MKKEQWAEAKRELREILREQSVEELEQTYKENQAIVAKWEGDEKELFTEKDKLYTQETQNIIKELIDEKPLTVVGDYEMIYSEREKR